jgi:hypothetical protein
MANLLANGLSAAYVVGLIAATIFSVGIFWLATIVYVAANRGNSKSQIGALCLAAEASNPVAANPTVVEAHHADADDGTTAFGKFKAIIRGGRTPEQHAAAVVAANGFEIVDCGSGVGTNSCLFASIHAQLPGNKGHRLNAAESNKVRAEHTKFAVGLFQSAVNDSPLSDGAKKAYLWVMEQVYSGKKRGKVPADIIAALKSERDAVAARPTIANSRGVKIYADSAEHVAETCRFRGRSCYFTSLSCDDEVHPDESELEGWNEAEAFCKNPSRTVEELLDFWTHSTFQSNAQQFFNSTSRVVGAEYACSIFDRLLSEKINKGLPVNYCDLLAVAFGLHEEIFRTDPIMTASSCMSMTVSENVMEKRCFELVENIKISKEAGVTSPIAEAAQLFLFFTMCTKNSGTMCDNPNVAVEAMRLEKDILLIGKIGGTGGDDSTSIRHINKQGLGVSRTDEIPESTIALHYTGNHYQAYVRRTK